MGKVLKIAGKIAPIVAPLALGPAGLGLTGSSLLGASAGVGALGGLASGGGLKGALAGGLTGGALGGGGALLGNTLGVSGALGNALGSGIIGAGAGGLTGGAKGALLGGALSGAGGYIQGSGGFGNAFKNITGQGALGNAGGGASSYASSDIYNNNIGRSLGGGLDASALNNIVTSAGSPSSSSNSLLTPLVSAGIGAYQNQQAQDQLIEGQDKAAAALAPYQNLQFDASQLANDPGYQFQLEQGTKAIDRAAASRGNYFSGQALTDAADYSKGLTDTTLQNGYNRFNTDRSTNIGLASGLGDIYTGIGNTRANATTNLGNILTGSLAAATGDKGVNSTGGIIDPNNISDTMLLQLLKQRGLGG